MVHGPMPSDPSQRLGVVVVAAKERRLLRIVTDPGRLDVLGEPAVQIDADGDLPVRPSLLPECEGAVRAVVAEILEPELRHSANPGAGVGEGAEHGTIAQADRPGGVDGREQLAGLLNRNLGLIAAVGLAGGYADVQERIEGDRMACHERIEELAERSQGLPLAGRGLAEAVYVGVRDARADLLERQLTRLAPREELADAPIVGATGVGVPDADREELVRGKTRRGAGLSQDRGEMSERIPLERGGTLGGQPSGHCVIHFR